VQTVLSPAFRKIGGVRAEPTPAGLPVAITSPGRSVRMFDPNDISSSTVWIISEVFASCITCPLSVNVTFSFCTSGTNSLGTMNGPSGAKVSCDFAISQSEPWRVSPRPPRSEMSCSSV
jgi:hypothetical protein